MLNNWIFVTNERDDRGKIGKKLQAPLNDSVETSGPDTKDAAKDPKNGLFYPFPSFFLPIEFIQIFNFPTSFSFFALIKISTNS